MFTDLYEDIYGYDYQSDEEHRLDVPFVPTDEKVVAKMLEMAGVTGDDLLYDLGCGDGRIAIAAAKEFGTRAVGIDLDPARLREAREDAEWIGVSPLVAFIEDDLFCVDFRKATVVTLYLLPSINLELRSRLLEELQPGTRIVSHAFDMADWKADRQLAAGGTNLYLWFVPANAAGTWTWHMPDGTAYRVKLFQNFQRLRGQAWIDDEPAKLHTAQLRGRRLKLVIQREEHAPQQTFIGHFSDGALHWDPDHNATAPVLLQ